MGEGQEGEGAMCVCKEEGKWTGRFGEVNLLIKGKGVSGNIGLYCLGMGLQGCSVIVKEMGGVMVLEEAV